MTLPALTDRIERGEPANAADVQALFDTPDLISVGALADDVRRRLHGTRATFVRVLEVHLDAPPASLPKEIAAGEIRIVGRPASLSGAVAAVRAVFAIAGGRPLSGFSLADLQMLASIEKRPLGEIVAGLRNAGLDSMAEVAVDATDGASAAVETARGSGLRVHRLTVHGLLPETRISTLERARDLQDLVGGFKAFAPLPRQVSVTAPTTGYADIKQIAAARLLVRNIPSIQVDWPLYGPKLAQVALTMGADDVDGVAAMDPGTLGTRRSPLEEIRGNIRAAALDPVERDGHFAILAPAGA